MTDISIPGFDIARMRLVVFFIISIILHTIILSMPWQVMARPTVHNIQGKTVPVRLVAQAIKDIPYEAPGISFDVEGHVSADYIEQLKARIFNAWQYPEVAIINGWDGKVLISFAIDNRGRLLSLDILTGSGHDLLDDAALVAIKRASPFGAFTEDLATDTIKIRAGFLYVLD
ncbi:MAG: energy transducer TonB [Thermodesulfobacteriota bacterium]|nr:energy transducer TonB [Thermodesulfobacteriota bacterium]